MGKISARSPRLLCISHEQTTITLSDGSTVKGYVNYSDSTGRELLVSDGADWVTRWVAHTDVKRDV